VTEELPFALKLLLIIIKKHIDVVHLNNDISRHTGSIIGAVLARKPIVITMRGSMGGYVSRISRALAKFVDQFICVSAYVRDDEIAFHVPPDRMGVVYDGIDLNRYQCDYAQRRGSTLKPIGYTVGIVGNLHRYKGHNIFIQAASDMIKTRDDINFVIVGKIVDEDYYRELTHLIQTLGIDKFLAFEGFVNNIPERLSQLDIFVHASIIAESFGMVICEAMAMELPVISTNMGGPKEIITNNKDGLLIDAGKPEELATAILRLLSDEALRVRLGRNARKTVEQKFDLQMTVTNLENLYEDVLT